MLVRPRKNVRRVLSLGAGGADKAALWGPVLPPLQPVTGAATALAQRSARARRCPRAQLPLGCQRPARAPLPEPLRGFLQPSLPRPQYVTWVTMAQVRTSPSSARPGWSDPGKHKYKPIAKLRTMSEM